MARGRGRCDGSTYTYTWAKRVYGNKNDGNCPAQTGNWPLFMEWLWAQPKVSPCMSVPKYECPRVIGFKPLHGGGGRGHR